MQNLVGEGRGWGGLDGVICSCLLKHNLLTSRVGAKCLVFAAAHTIIETQKHRQVDTGTGTDEQREVETETH